MLETMKICFCGLLSIPCSIVNVGCLRTEDGSDDDDYDDSEESHERPKTGTVSLMVSNLNAQHTLNESADHSAFAAHGLDPERIKQVLRNPPCECKCRVPYKVLLQACVAFWQLPKESQDACLWSLQQSGDGRKTTWMIEGL